MKSNIKRALFIDTSMQGALLALVEYWENGFKILRWQQTPVPQEAASALPRLCTGLLAQEGLLAKDIEFIVCGLGPGSFTGIKIGLSFVLGWKAAQPQIKVAGVSALRGLCRRDSSVWILPATQHAGYFVCNATHAGPELGTFELDGGIRFSQTVPAGARLKVIGAWPKFEELAGKEGYAIQSIDVLSIGYCALEGMVEEFIANSAHLSDGGELRPIYMRKSAPEEKAEKAKS